MATDPMWCFENYGEAAEYIDELEDRCGYHEQWSNEFRRQVEYLQPELTSLRAFKAACDGQKPVAVVTDVYGLVWYGSGPIAPIVRRNNIAIGTHLYANPDHEAAQLRMRIADLERQLANERASAIHTCGPNCQRPGCVERRERDHRVAEACAKVCEEERIGLEENRRVWEENPMLKPDDEWIDNWESSARSGDIHAAEIRSGEWKKHMKGGE